MAKKRVVTKIGDVFCVELGDGKKGYFQYIAKDWCQLNSTVIRVFKTHYQDYEPSVDEIVKGEVDFYAHTILRIGVVENVWHKIGKSEEIGIEGLKEVIFGYTDDIIVKGTEIFTVNPLDNWRIWRIGDGDFRKIGRLSSELSDIVEPGGVEPYVEIISRMKYGYYKYTQNEHSVLKRRPRLEVHSYTRVEGDDVVYYFHFLGENVVEEIVVENGVSALLTPQTSSAHGHTLCEAPFYATNWKHCEFITREEFEEAESSSFACEM